MAYATEGRRDTPEIALDVITKVTSSGVGWTADEPEGTSVSVYARLSSETAWTLCENGSPLPNVQEGDDLSGLSLRLRAVLKGDGAATPVLSSLQVRVRQTDDPRVILGVEYGNVMSYRHTLDSSAYKTVAYVGGSGEGSARIVQKVAPGGAGVRRRELWVDASDAEDLDELTERGTQELALAADVDAYELEAIDRQFAYGEDWNLGDFVTVVVPGGEYRSLQVTGVTETYEPGAVGVLPTFGVPAHTLDGALSGLSRRITRKETT